MASPIPRTYWVNFKTGEEYHPPSPRKPRFALEPTEEKIPFPYSYQRLILDEEEFREVKAAFIQRVNDRRFMHIYQARIGKK